MTYPLPSNAVDLVFSDPVATTADLTFGGTPPVASGAKYWNGSAWVTGTARRWNGSAWVPVVARRWDGSAWVNISL